MRLLIYSWACVDGKSLAGGGVTVYLRRLVPYLVSDGVELILVSQGASLSAGQPHMQRTETDLDSLGVISYRLHNSDVPQPYRKAFGHKAAMEPSKADKVLIDFVAECEDIDVVHFHGLEGLTPAVLSLSQVCAKTSVFFTAHNYHLVCQQIQLFRLASMQPCQDFLSGAACVNCLAGNVDNVGLSGVLEQRYPRLSGVLATLKYSLERCTRLLRHWSLSLAKQLGRPGHSRHDSVQQPLTVTDYRAPAHFKALAEHHAAWRNQNLSVLNGGSVELVAVSKLAKRALERAGVRDNRVHVISPAVVSQRGLDCMDTLEQPDHHHPICISFWGYPTPSKGLSLFLDACLALASQSNQRHAFRVLIVSDTQRKCQSEFDQLSALGVEVKLIGQYASQDMAAIAKMTQLAVIPSLWEETYCQVASELFFLKVPTLCSSTLGFAQHVRDSKFVFESGKIESLVEKMAGFIKSPDLLKDYWVSTEAPPSLEMNVQDYMALYRRSDTLGAG